MTRRRVARSWDASAFVLLLSALFQVAKQAAFVEARMSPHNYLSVVTSAYDRRANTRRHPHSCERCGLDKESAATIQTGLEEDGQERHAWESKQRLSISYVGRIAAVLRGGESRTNAAGDVADFVDGRGQVDGDSEEEEERVEYDEKAVDWMMQQLCMYQTRTALISRPLAAKGYKLREIVPSPRGLICALSTEERRMDCRMYVEAEVGKKVVAPCKCKGTQKWISFSALNSERRKEVAKWKNCPVCQGPIDYKLYEVHGGEVGKAISAVLNNQRATRAAIGVSVGLVLLIVSPVLHTVLVRVLTSGILWQHYHRLNFLIHLPLPLQIMSVRFLMKYGYERLLVLDSLLRRWLTDVESHILEARLPVTVEVDHNGEEVAIANPRP